MFEVLLPAGAGAELADVVMARWRVPEDPRAARGQVGPQLFHKLFPCASGADGIAFAYRMIPPYKYADDEYIRFKGSRFEATAIRILVTLSRVACMSPIPLKPLPIPHGHESIGANAPSTLRQKIGSVTPLGSANLCESG